jgi:hypothetical protein
MPAETPAGAMAHGLVDALPPMSAGPPCGLVRPMFVGSVPDGIPVRFPPVGGEIAPVVPSGPPPVIPVVVAHAPLDVLEAPPRPAAAPVGALAQPLVPPAALLPMPAGRPDGFPFAVPVRLPSAGSPPVGTLEPASPPPGAFEFVEPSGPPLAPVGAAQLPAALPLAPPPTPAPTPAGARAHGLTPAEDRSTASATKLLVDAAPAPLVGAVATGSVVAAAPPSGADELDVASAGTVAGPLPPLTVAPAGGPLADEPGCVVCVLDPKWVGSVRAGTIAGTAFTTGVSPVPVVAASAAPVGCEATPQLPLAVAVAPLFTPAPAPVGATRHGSVATAVSVPMLSGEISAPAAASVGLVMSGVVAPAAPTAGSPAMTGATAASSPVAAGLDTSGAALVATLAEACGSVSDPEVSGSVALASTFVGAVTTGCACAAPLTEAGGCALDGCAGAAEALAPDLLAVALLDPPAEGLLTWAVVGDETLGLVTTVVDAPPPGGFTVAEVGAVTCGDTGAVLAAGAAGAAGTAGGATWAATGGADNALIRKRIKANDALERAS